jgi:hypothetical protein
MSDYPPTIGDMWPTPDQEQLAAIEANPTHPSKTWWQVDKTEQGVVTCVWVNKPTGKAVGLWTFTLAVDDDGTPIIRISRSRLVDPTWAAPVNAWQVTAELDDAALAFELAGLVGKRTASGVVQRLRPR